MSNPNSNRSFAPVLHVDGRLPKGCDCRGRPDAAPLCALAEHRNHYGALIPTSALQRPGAVGAARPSGPSRKDPNR